MRMLAGEIGYPALLWLVARRLPRAIWRNRPGARPAPSQKRA
jgi:hypothetical protein